MNVYKLLLVTLIAASGIAHAAEVSKPANSMTPTARIAGAVTMSDETICPAPYVKYTLGVDESKGESYCAKSAAICPSGYSGKTNDLNGQQTCTQKVDTTPPLGWSTGVGSGILVFNSIPQPMVKCPKATKDWPWGTRYYKEAWNKMGCVANLKPAY